MALLRQQLPPDVSPALRDTGAVPAVLSSHSPTGLFWAWAAIFLRFLRRSAFSVASVSPRRLSNRALPISAPSVSRRVVCSAAFRSR